MTETRATQESSAVPVDNHVVDPAVSWIKRASARIVNAPSIESRCKTES